MALRLSVALACALVPASASTALPEGSPRSAVLYSIGVSTNLYGKSSPRGFGVATGIVSGPLVRVERRAREYGGFQGADWLTGGRILVHRHAPPLKNPAIFTHQDGRLRRAGLAPFPGGSSYWWAPDGKQVAYEPPAPCRPHQRSLFSCYRGSGRVFVSGLGLVAHGTLGGWTPGGRLVVYAGARAANRGDATFLDLPTRVRSLRHHYFPDEQPIRSADGRYSARRHGVRERTQIIVTRGRRVVQTMETHYALSMFAWSTRGHLLAYTTSGFPAPHQLWVVDPEHAPRRIFATGAKHFDWITWSPDGRFILLDGDSYGGWHVFSARTGREVRTLPRLGGRPLWCCPVNEYRGNGR